MKKLIQILIVCGLFVFMGGTARAGECDYAKIFDVIASDDNYPDKAMHRVSILFKEYWDAPGEYDDPELQKAFYDSLFNLSKQGNGQASYLAGIIKLSDFKYEEATKYFNLSLKQKYLKGYDRVIPCYEKSIKRNTKKDGSWGGRGVKGLDEALKWYRLAAEQGNANAQKNIEIAENIKRIELAENNKPLIVFAIESANDGKTFLEKKNDFEEIEMYIYGFGCMYTISVTNKTNEKISVNSVNLKSKLLSDDSHIPFIANYEKMNSIVEPGQTIIGETSEYMGRIEKIFRRKDLLDKDEINNYMKQYNCSAQKGSMYLGYMDIKFKKNSPLKAMDRKKLIKQLPPLNPN
jgi:TPR repeat protein